MARWHLKSLMRKMTLFQIAMSKDTWPLPCLGGLEYDRHSQLLPFVALSLLPSQHPPSSSTPLFVFSSRCFGMKGAALYLPNASCCLWHICSLVVVPGLSCYMTGYDRVNKL